MNINLHCIILLAIILSGCQTTHEVLVARQDGEGTSVTYPIGSDQAWNVAHTVLRWSGAEAIEEHRDKNYMLTTFNRNFVSWGTCAGVWVEQAAAEETKVTAITKRICMFNLFTNLTEKTFHTYYALAVGTIMSGEPLPDVMPEYEEEVKKGKGTHNPAEIRDPWEQ